MKLFKKLHNILFCGIYKNMQNPYYPEDINTNRSEPPKAQNPLFNLVMPLLAKNKDIQNIFSLLSGKSSPEILASVMQNLQKKEEAKPPTFQKHIDEY